MSGTLHDGQIIVNAEDTDKVQLVLNGVNITSATSAAIYVAQADKVFVTTASGSENTLTNGGEYIAIDENNIDAVIFSKSDLTVNGEGALTIDTKAGHGIVSKDDLALTSGTYTITAASQGLSGKNSVRIADGTYQITAGKDAVHAENTDDADKGFVYIAGGTLHLTCNGNTALDCDGTYTNTGGSIMTNDGSEENPNEMGGGGQGAPNNQNGQGGTPPSNGQAPQKDGETA